MPASLMERIECHRSAFVLLPLRISLSMGAGETTLLKEVQTCENSCEFSFVSFSKGWRRAVGEIFNSDSRSPHQPNQHRVFADLELALFRDD